MSKNDVDTESTNAYNVDDARDSDVDYSGLSSVATSVVGSDHKDEIPVVDPFYCNTEKRKTLISHLRTLKASDRKKFMMEPLPDGVWLECYVDRASLGRSPFNRRFSLHVDSKSKIFLASCVKQKHNLTANYLISTNPNIGSDASREDDFAVGKLRSNWLGSQFMAYDTGLNPAKMHAGSVNSAGLPELVREELVSLKYEHAFFGKKEPGPKRMHVVIPHVKKTRDGPERIPCKAIAPEVDGLTALTRHWSLATVAHGNAPLVQTCTTKIAAWDSRRKAYVLNFNNRVRQVSVKNFQLVASDDPNNVLLQFGKSDGDRFILDFRYPLSPFQAFSIAITTMDYKICSE